MTDTVFVAYAADGSPAGVYACEQSFPTTQMQSDDARVVAFLNPPKPQTVLSQDLMAQFTVADYGSIKVAVAGSDQFGLLWASLQAQRDPMNVTNARFLAGWKALVSVLGQSRMDAIAAALGVTVA